MVCAECHRGSDSRLSGQKLIDVPGEFGEFYSFNITNHPEHGIGKYTDGELFYLFRTGIKRNGKQSMIMPKFYHTSDEDVYSLIAYLRSDTRPVQASNKPSVPSRPSLFGKFLERVAIKPLPFPEEPVIAPPVSDKTAYGEYIVHRMVSCYDGHSANFSTNNALEPPKSKGY